uniref:Uncharacterized protein n=1 Tax=Helianthus annuus TaxID=4232 RepID=A0A251TMC0_HELAN
MSFGDQDFWDRIRKSVQVFGKDRRNKCIGLDILFPLSGRFRDQDHKRSSSSGCTVK